MSVILECGTWGEWFFYPTLREEIHAALRVHHGPKITVEQVEHCAGEYELSLGLTLPHPWFYTRDTIYVELEEGESEPPAPPGYPPDPNGYLDIPRLILRECSAWDFARDWGKG